jgi:hypothetical protein
MRNALQLRHAAVLILLVLVLGNSVSAQPVQVKYREGTVHGFLALRSQEGKLLASGELFQTASGDRVNVRLVFHFKDGSIDDDQAVFTQRGSFRLLTDHHVQSGPTFPEPMDMLIDVANGKVTVHDEKDKAKEETSHLDLPRNVANGMLFTIIKNIPPDTNSARFGFVVAAPKPRLVEFNVTREGRAMFSIAGAERKATRFRIKIELGGVTGTVAKIIGKQPPDINIWVLEGKVPAFIRMEGALFEGGPIWTIELTAPADFKPES